MKVSIFLLSSILHSALAWNGPKGCDADNCARDVTGTRLGAARVTQARADCTSILAANPTAQAVPTYVHNCPNFASYSSACSCWGAVRLHQHPPYAGPTLTYFIYSSPQHHLQPAVVPICSPTPTTADSAATSAHLALASTASAPSQPAKIKSAVLLPTAAPTAISTANAIPLLMEQASAPGTNTVLASLTAPLLLTALPIQCAWLTVAVPETCACLPFATTQL